MPRKTPVPDVPVFDTGDTPLTEEAIVAEYREESQKEQPPVPEPTPIRTLVATAADHHLVVGMASLANMDEDEFRAKLAVMKKGYERIGIIQKELMTEGVDYGKVPGIAKPFLHQPGAEMLSNLYGFAVEQVAERIVRKVGDDPGTPPYAFVTKSFVHLGDTTGPIVAEGSGEANPYEEKYHYRFVNPGCPVCGKVGAILMRKNPPALAGKKQCMNWPAEKGGCGTVFEPNDPRLAPSTKEPMADVDLWGLAETILAMSAKRSLVAAIRRATGTSGLFTQDEDSPSVQRQSAESNAGDTSAPPPVIETAVATEAIAPGGKGTAATAVQLDRLKVVAKEKGLKGAQIAELLERLFGMKGVERNGAAAMAAVKTLDADRLGNLLAFIEVGDLDSVGDKPADPGFPPQQSDEM